MRPWQANVGRTGDKVISLSASTQEGTLPSSESVGASASPQREWMSAIELVQEASEAIRITEERAVDLENQLKHVITQAEDEIKSLQQKLASQQTLLNQSEERARRGEARAKEAEAWLIRLHDAVFTAFGPKSRSKLAGNQQNGADSVDP
ncbi:MULTISPECIES: hypothetical protein [unclassified Methylobacterium]|uniref:TolC family protein n=1 Tax=unclassified Methylobacterium TaxID=2615210 RepID=UPI001FCDC6FD|nr:MULTISPECIES: hypothetical protein [unclassified Methylobacterium]